MRFDRPLRDFAGRALCDSCWNIDHEHCTHFADQQTSCECLCRSIAEEAERSRRARAAKRKKAREAKKKPTAVDYTIREAATWR